MQRAYHPLSTIQLQQLPLTELWSASFLGAFGGAERRQVVRRQAAIDPPVSSPQLTSGMPHLHLGAPIGIRSIRTIAAEMRCMGGVADVV